MLGGKLELHQLVIEPVDGRAPKHRALGVVEVAIGGVGVEQLGHLDDEPLEHGLEPQLARDDLGGGEQCRLLLESLLVLLEELRRVKRDPDLAGHGLGQRDLCFGPWTRLGSVQPEDADHPVEDEDRSREHGERVEVEHALDPSELGVLQGGLRAHVADGDRSPLAGREIRDRKPIVVSADRNEALRVPLGANGHRPTRLAEPQEAALGAHGLAGLLDGDPQDRLQIELGSNLASDRRHQALPLERLGERARRSGAIEGERSLGGQGLEQRELLSREDPPLPGRREHEHRQHLLVARRAARRRRSSPPPSRPAGD